MADDDVQRAIGGLQARTSILELRFAAMETRLDERLDVIDQRIASVHDAITGARGGWRVLALLGGIVAFVSTFAIAIYHFLFAR